MNFLRPALPKLTYLFLLAILLVQCETPEESKVIAVEYPQTIRQIPSRLAQKLATDIRSEVSVEVDEGLELSLWAADTLAGDPVAVTMDEQGHLYFTQGSRLQNSEFDIRSHRDWMTASISFQSVEDRRNFLRTTFARQNEQGERFLKDLNDDDTLDWRDLTVQKEKIWMLSDEDEDGIAEKAQLYVDDFNEEVSDLSNGLTYHDGDMFMAVAPDLWRLRDLDGDNIADTKESISHGWGVHIGFGAHGMSGVTVGPQGRIWWGIGDIGMNVVDQDGKRWKYPNRGVVVRADPDGSNFEVYAMGVRNTHEFVFDKYGNLISEDNDGDHAGERERLVYLINGSDTGWRINWQFGKYTDPDNNGYKVWMDEKMHVPHWEGQAAYFLPPIANYVNGPTGMVYNPGTALGPEWQDHFFISEFRGTASASPIHAFKLKPKGASFELDQTKEVTKGLLPTGIEFGPDGAMYFGDWITGWGVKQKGRIWKLDVPGGDETELRKEVERLISSDFSSYQPDELRAFLGHADMRIRRKSQFELVKRGQIGFEVFNNTIAQTDNQLARIHGIWGISQMARTQNLTYADVLIPHLTDGDPEIVTQAAKMLGDVRYQNAGDALLPLLNHASLRVQMHAIEALGRLQYNAAFQPVVEVIAKNDNQDLWLRHASMIALSRLGTSEALVGLRQHASEAVRIAAVVALRRMEDPGVAVFLDDTEFIATEAARAINDDFSIEPALSQLAGALKHSTFTNEAFLRRAINANLRVAQSENLEILLDYASNSKAPESMRAEAIAALSTWAKPSPLDRVDGRYRGEVERDIAPVIEALEPVINELLTAEPAIQIAASKAVGKLKLTRADAALINLVNTGTNAAVRKSALEALASTNSNSLSDALSIAINDQEVQVRSTALTILPKSAIEEQQAVTFFTKLLATGAIEEQQSIYNSLGTFKGPEAVATLGQALKTLRSGQAAPAIQLDIIEAIEKQGNATLMAELKSYHDSKASDPVSQHIEVLEGGDSGKGWEVFYQHEAAQCVRCHSIFELGGNAGPNLKGVANRLSKKELLKSLVDPSAQLAAGFGVVLLDLKNGEQLNGTLMAETSTTLTVKSGQEESITVRKSEIEQRRNMPSSMPVMTSLLTKRELRDVLAFISGLNQEVD
ncbi:MAG: HEAT repeat domain-containing protein [Cytophagales bacterium]|nr:HEAT repeat domain-containing protein [Cytophagales bacterium]